MWSSPSPRRTSVRRGAAAALAAALAAGVAACGVGVGAGKDQTVGLLVTRDFGRVAVGGGERTVKAPSSDTVMRLLDRTHKVSTRFGGGFVQTIDTAKAGTRDGRPVDWFFYVDGSLSGEGAASIVPRAGDRVWWDLHDWAATPDVNAVVGSFPEPFLHGARGRSPRVLLECAPAVTSACATAAARLKAIGAGPIRRVAIGTAATRRAVRVLVGPWRALRADTAARRLERGPAASGVFARPASGGGSIAVLDARGAAALTLRAGAGLVAATATPGGPPTWLVTGTDARGVARAAAALTEQALDARFAVAVAPDGTRAVPAP